MADVSAIFRWLDVVRFQGVDGYQCSIGELSGCRPARREAIGHRKLKRMLEVPGPAVVRTEYSTDPKLGRSVELPADGHRQ